MPIEQSDLSARDLWTHSTHSKQTNKIQNIITDVLAIIDNIFYNVIFGWLASILHINFDVKIIQKIYLKY